MARFYMKLHNPSRVRIEISDDLLSLIKPTISKIFGVPFLASEKMDGRIFVYDFKPNDGDFENGIELLKSIYDSRIVKDMDIDLNMN